MAEEENKGLSNFQANQAIVLARLDERTQHIVSNLVDFRTQVDRQITDLKDDVNKKVEDVKKEFQVITESFSEELGSKVSQDSFEPVKMLTYGVAGLLLAAIITAIAASVLTPNDPPVRGSVPYEVGPNK